MEDTPQDKSWLALICPSQAVLTLPPSYFACLKDKNLVSECVKKTFIPGIFGCINKFLNTTRKSVQFCIHCYSAGVIDKKGKVGEDDISNNHFEMYRACENSLDAR